MAGYMTKLAGYNYEGELTNGASDAVENGILMAHGTGANVDKFVMPTASADTKLLCKEVTTIYDGIPAYRFVVNALAANLYLVECGFDVDESVAYDKTLYTTPVGKHLRAHPLAVGEEFITTMVDGTPAAGTEYGVLATGLIGVVSAST